MFKSARFNSKVSNVLTQDLKILKLSHKILKCYSNSGIKAEKAQNNNLLP